MRKIITSTFGLLAAVALYATFGGVSTAEAGQKCASAACMAYLKSENEALRAEINSLRGGVTVRTQRRATVRVHRQVRQQVVRRDVGGDLVCGMAMQRGTGPLVATVGKYRDKDFAEVLHTANPQWQSVGQGIYKAKFCMPRSKLANVNTFTICGSVGHYTFYPHEAAQFRNQSGRLTSNDIFRMWKGG